LALSWYNVGTVKNKVNQKEIQMLTEKELNWMSENAAEVRNVAIAAVNEIRNYYRGSDKATAKCQAGRCIEISLSDPDRNDPLWDELPRVGCRVSVLKDNGFERVTE
jgi:hypothetical protein